MEPLMNLDAVEEIHEIFIKINACKAKVEELKKLKISYADAVNELMEINIEDSVYGEEISGKALELGKTLNEARDAEKMLVTLEDQLINQYGFMRKKAA